MGFGGWRLAVLRLRSLLGSLGRGVAPVGSLILGTLRGSRPTVRGLRERDGRRASVSRGQHGTLPRVPGGYEGRIRSRVGDTLAGGELGQGDPGVDLEAVKACDEADGRIGPEERHDANDRSERRRDRTEANDDVGEASTALLLLISRCSCLALAPFPHRSFILKRGRR